MKTSQIELLVREYLAFYFPDFKPAYNARPDFLRNEHTGKNFELDIWYPELKIAVEVNGITHKLPFTKRRDQTKHAWCSRAGIRLFSIQGKCEQVKSLRFQITRHFQKLNQSSHLIKRLQRDLPSNLRIRIEQYEPSLKAFGDLGRMVRYRTSEQSYLIAQKQETDFIRRRMAEKGIHIKPKPRILYAG